MKKLWSCLDRNLPAKKLIRNIFPNKVARSSSNYYSVPFDGLLIFVHDLAAQKSTSQAGPKSKKSQKDMTE